MGKVWRCIDWFEAHSGGTGRCVAPTGLVEHGSFQEVTAPGPSRASADAVHGRVHYMAPESGNARSTNTKAPSSTASAMGMGCVPAIWIVPSTRGIGARTSTMVRVLCTAWRGSTSGTGSRGSAAARCFHDRPLPPCSPWLQGHMSYADGRDYAGGWRHGKFDGFGRLRLASGDAYEGPVFTVLMPS